MFNQSDKVKLNKIYEKMFPVNSICGLFPEPPKIHVMDEKDEKIHELNKTVNQLKLTNEDLKYTLQSQQETISLLTQALCKQYKEGFFLTYYKFGTPIIIQNGEEVTSNRNTIAIDFNWVSGEIPKVNIESQINPKE